MIELSGPGRGSYLLSWEDIPLRCFLGVPNCCGSLEAGLSSSYECLAQEHGLLVRLINIIHNLLLLSYQARLKVQQKDLTLL